MKAGLRIDVDTYRGTKLGVPRLLSLLRRHGVRGTFFFTVGPDNMGRNLWRLLRPVFAWKMLRTRAVELYGWDILLRGTLWPGPRIGLNLQEWIKAAADAGHEIGLHAWDHHRWQAKLGQMTESQIRLEMRRGFDELSRILGRPPSCSAAPGWVCNERALRVKAEFPFLYNSDCRGDTIFRPVVGGSELDQLQVPVSLPTYDEVIGRNQIDYYQYVLSLFSSHALNVLTVHAEVEGVARADMFDDFLSKASAKGIRFVPLGGLLSANRTPPRAAIIHSPIPGRQGCVAHQAPVEPGT